MTIELQSFMDGLIWRNPNEKEFHQSVYEVAKSVIPVINATPEYLDSQILERLTEPDRAISFRVVWQDDQNQIRVNRGYRVQFNNAIGPYKGGLRFHRSVNFSILKFLGFEQIFKNSLTTLPMGAGKGGANFNPKGKSDGEVMRFCQSYMTELQKYIGPDTDVPAGDIGVGSREISFMYGQYKRIVGEFTGVLTGKGLEYGGSLVRTEATGYGCVYFMEEMLKRTNRTIENKTCIVSGSGNVAIYATEKILQMGGKVVSLSDSDGSIHDPDGIDKEKLEYLKDLKFKQRGRLKEYAEHYGCTYLEGQTPWSIPADLVFPCATQNELNKKDATRLIKNGAIAVSEGANMPTENNAIEAFQKAGVLFAPGKASNAGGVAVSGLEMAQNSARLSWSAEELERKLQSIMAGIHEQCVAHGSNEDTVDYVQGANIAGFHKVARAMLAFGAV